MTAFRKNRLSQWFKILNLKIVKQFLIKDLLTSSIFNIVQSTLV